MNTATVSDAFATNRISESTFESALPPKWIPRKQQPDFHIDYLVEMTEAGELTGLQFGVQLKGWTPKRSRVKAPCYSLSTKHLLYFVEKCTFPVFLVLVDVTDKRSYWVFIQQYAKDTLDVAKLKRQRNVTVRFGPETILRDAVPLTKLIKQAAEYVRELHPGSVNAAIAHKQQILSGLDPRVEARVDVVNGKTHVSLIPKQNMAFELKLSSHDRATVLRLNKAIEKGTEVELNASNVQIHGAPILHDLLKQEKSIVLRHSHALPAHCRFWWGQGGVHEHFYVPGLMHRGTKFVTFESEIGASPLTVAASLSIETMTQCKPFTMSFGLHPRKWNGQQLGSLAHFKSIVALVEAMHRGDPIKTEFSVQGNDLGPASMTDMPKDGIGGMYEIFQILKKARKIAEHFKSNPVMTSIQEAYESRHDIFELSDLLDAGEHRVNVKNVTVNTSFGLNFPPESANQPPAPLTIQDAELKYAFFQSPVVISNVVVTFTAMRLTKYQPRADEPLVDVRFESTASTERIVKWHRSSD